MAIFTMAVTICSGISVIIGLLIMLVKPIREKVLKTKEKEEAQNQAIKTVSDKVDSLAETVNSIVKTQDIDNAKRNREKILTFADEIYRGVLHSREHFQNVMDCETEYNRYCEQHPEFKNKRTEQAQIIIDSTYRKCEEEHSFLA